MLDWPTDRKQQQQPGGGVGGGGTVSMHVCIISEWSDLLTAQYGNVAHRWLQCLQSIN